MFATELRQLNDAELLTKFLDLKEELFNLRFQNATSSLEKHNLIPALKKDIARVETVLTERNLTASAASESNNSEAFAASEETTGSERSEGRETAEELKDSKAQKKKVK